MSPPAEVFDPTSALPAPKAAAAVVLMRDADAGIEVLLLQRSAALQAFAGVWAFPGGTVEAADIRGAGQDAELATARRTAVREVHEETDLALPAAALTPHAYWITPPGMPHRFATWFFLAKAPGAEVHPAPREVADWSWYAPEAALAAHVSGRLTFMPPVYLALQRLRPFGSVDHALAVLGAQPPERFRPRMVKIDGGICFLYEEDCAYQSGDLQQAGARHRLWARTGDWRYEREAAGA